MTLFDDMRSAAIDLLDEFGEQVTITRPGGEYDPATRKRGTGGGLTQILMGTLSTPRPGDTHMVESMAILRDRDLIATPTPVSGSTFDPIVGDLVTAQGRTWAVVHARAERRQGVLIAHFLALKAQ